MKLKFLSFDLAEKRPRYIDSYLNMHLKNLESTEFIDFPINDFYILVCHLNNNHWCNSQKAIDNKILSLHVGHSPYFVHFAKQLI